MSLNLRTIGKFGFLLAAIGFFMPVACDQNAFQLIEYVEAPTPFLIIGLFVLAVAGIIIGALLLMKKNVPVAVDWAIILVSIGFGAALLSKNELELQYGAYFIITGFVLALIFQIISSFPNISVKTVVAIGIGAALMFVLNRFVFIPSGVPDTNLNLGVAILAVFAAIFGPIAGLLIGFIGHTLVDLTAGWGIWWSWIAGSALFGLGVGFFWKFFKIEEGEFGMKQAVIFNAVQIIANFVAFVGISQTLDVLIYQEPASKVYVQSLVAASLNSAVVLILGTLLIIGYSKTRTKAGSLKAE